MLESVRHRERFQQLAQPAFQRWRHSLRLDWMLWLSLLISVAPAPALASWPSDPSQNLSVFVAPGSRLSRLYVISDRTGGAFVVYNTYPFGLFAQHLDAMGNPANGWAVTPKIVADSAYYSGGANAVDDLAGGIALSWDDLRPSSPGLYCQRLTADGTPLWGGRGTQVQALGVGGNQNSVIRADPTAGYFVVWSDWRSSSGGMFGYVRVRAYAQRFLPNGMARWATNGIRVCPVDDPQGVSSADPDGTGGLIVLWGAQRRASGVYDGYAQRLDSLGNAQWDESGVLVCTTEAGTAARQVVADGAGGAFILWRDYRLTGPNTTGQLYANHLSGAGTLEPAWPVDGLALEGDSTNVLGTEHPCMIPDGVGGVYVAWTEFYYGFIRLQHLGPGGAVRWPNGGLVLAQGVSLYCNVALCSDQAGGAIVTWSDNRNPSHQYDLLAQRIDSTGAFLWAPGGAAISTAIGAQDFPQMAVSGTGGGIVAWQDERNGNYDVYAQNVNGDGSLGGGVVDVLVSLISASAGPDGVQLSWQLGASVSGRITVERSNVPGAWRALGDIVPDGTSRLSYTDHDVVSGQRYGYRLQYGSNRTTSAESWVQVPRLGELSLAGARPNPVTADLSIAFSLDSSAPARLELFDVRGRRVASREVGGQVGAFQLRLMPAGQLEPGLYWITLTRGTSRLTRRVAVVH